MKKLTGVLFSIGVFLALCSPVKAQNDWQNLDPLNSTTTLNFVSITSDINGVPYIAFSDSGIGGKIRVKKFENSSLTEVGNAGAITYTDGEILINPVSNQLYFLSDDDQGVHLLKFNGSGWENLGGKACDSMGKLGFDPASGDPYVVCSIDEEEVLVKKFNGSSWENVGGSWASDGEIYGVDIAISPTTREPYVAYEEEYTWNNSKVTVKKYSGGNWVAVGSSQTDSVYGETVKIVIDGLGNPYISYIGSAGHLKKFDGASWNEVGDTGFLTFSSDAENRFLDFDINLKNNLPQVFYGVFKSYSSNGYNHIRKYNGSSWVLNDIWGTGLNSPVANSGTYYGGISISKQGDAFVGFDFYSYTNNMSHWDLAFYRNSYIESNRKTITHSKSNPIYKKQVVITVPQVVEKTQKKGVTVKFNNRKVKVLKVRKSGNNLVVTVAMKYKKWPKGYYNLLLSYKYKSGKKLLSKTVSSNTFIKVY